MDALSILCTVPGLERAWPGKNGGLVFESRDDEGRLRGGSISPDGVTHLLDYARDPALPGLTPDLDGELVVHRAGRRAVVVGPGWVRKLLRPGRASMPASQELAQALGSMGLRTAEIREVGHAHIDFELLPGRSLGDLGDAGLPGWRRLAQAWGALGRASGDAHGGLPVHGPAQEAEVLRHWLERALEHGVLAGLVEDPQDLETAVDTACASLMEDPGELVLAHRDLHEGQLLWDGTDLSVLDLDTAARAEAALDLGNLLCHVELMALRGRLSPSAHQRIEGLVEDMAARTPTTGARLAAYRHASALRLIFVHAFRPTARAWLPQWVQRRLEHTMMNTTKDWSAPCA